MGAGDGSPAVAASNASLEDDLAYYKSQYEQLELELQEFQASSRDLETELERDIEASEKRERQLKEKVEALTFEVNEWKAKHKQSKAEANAAQNKLEKEITSLRESNRALQLKLRDIEVANDDFERQARNTTSSLEDLESKYNVAIERGVMLEEEVKVIEKEREEFRIEAQHLRDELSDLKIEADIVREKLRNAEAIIDGFHGKRPQSLAEDSRPRSPASETSTSVTTFSAASPTMSTPPQLHSGASHVSTPPSPPLSEVSGTAKPATANPLPRRAPSVSLDKNATPRPSAYQPRSRHTRRPSIPITASGRTTPSVPRRPGPTSRPNAASLPRSGSLYQVRGLVDKMQKLQERVHTVRSKLPAPAQTPPRASPRSANPIPSTVTVRRSSRKQRTSGGTPTSFSNGRERQSINRLSFGLSSSTTDKASRPSSRGSGTSGATLPRPSSRASMSGSRTPLGSHYPTSSISELRHPRSSFGGSHAATRIHGHNGSIGGEDMSLFTTPTARRTTLEKKDTAIPTPSGLPRRQSGGLPVPKVRRATHSMGRRDSEMGPPPARSRKLSEVGETF